MLINTGINLEPIWQDKLVPKTMLVMSFRLMTVQILLMKQKKKGIPYFAAGMHRCYCPETW